MLWSETHVVMTMPPGPASPYTASLLRPLQSWHPGLIFGGLYIGGFKCTQGSPTRGPHTVVVCLVDALPQQRPGDGAVRAEPSPVVDAVAGLMLLCSYSLEATSEMLFSLQGAHKDCGCMAA